MPTRVGRQWHERGTRRREEGSKGIEGEWGSQAKGEERAADEQRSAKTCEQSARERKERARRTSSKTASRPLPVTSV